MLPGAIISLFSDKEDQLFHLAGFTYLKMPHSSNYDRINLCPRINRDRRQDCVRKTNDVLSTTKRVFLPIHHLQGSLALSEIISTGKAHPSVRHQETRRPLINPVSTTPRGSTSTKPLLLPSAILFAPQHRTKPLRLPVAHLLPIRIPFHFRSL